MEGATAKPLDRAQALELMTRGNQLATAATLTQAFESRVAAAPDALAFKHGNLALSYVEFDGAANRLAHAMLDTGALPGERVALLARTPVHQAVAQIATLKAGLVCVPLDPGLPPHRLERVAADSGVTLALIDRESEAATTPFVQRRSRILRIDQLPPGLPGDRPASAVTPHALAYLLYTSGSTGQPKGVMQTHRNLLHVTRLYRSDLGVTPQDRITNPSALVYTAPIWALLASLTSGASYIVADASSARRLVAAMAQEGVTVLQAIVSLLRQILNDLDEAVSLPLLRLAYTGGETLHRADVASFVRVFGDRCRLMMDLGTTEASIITHLAADEWARDADSGAEASLLPCGRPVASVDVTLVDDRGKPVAAGAIGEIVVRSPFLSPGYWNQPELTARQFRPDPLDAQQTAYFSGDLGRWLADGNLLHLGRADDQVKIRAHKVHLAEVEAAMRELPEVRAAAVVALEDASGATRLAAFVVMEPAASLSAQDIRHRLAASLPSYMLPSTIEFLDRLPAVDNGKLDRAALAARARTGDATRTDLPFEPNSLLRALALMWAEILGAAPTTAADDFFAMGGDSLRMMQLIAKIEATWGARIELRDLFEQPTLQQMARYLESRIDPVELSRSGP